MMESLVAALAALVTTWDAIIEKQKGVAMEDLVACRNEVAELLRADREGR